MADKDGKNSKQVILDAATQEFAEKGFDGARVDEIARRAGVNKALIYYYFASKDKILEELMVSVVDEMVALKDQLTQDSPSMTIKQFFNNVQTDGFIDPIFQFIKKRKLLLQIITSEALKDDSSGGSFFEMIDLVMEDSMRRVKQLQGEIRDVDEFLIAALFFAFIPMVNFINFGEKWARYKHLDYATLEGQFFKFFKGFYRNYFIHEYIWEE